MVQIFLLLVLVSFVMKFSKFNETFFQFAPGSLSLREEGGGRNTTAPGWPLVQERVALAAVRRPRARAARGPQGASPTQTEPSDRSGSAGNP